ncbi:MAG: hypothetical protein JXR96_15685 [Deltaproteobacteria bacterium]|nr:hypothetical protein [Deltaproteobacteria bacterium]
MPEDLRPEHESVIEAEIIVQDAASGKVLRSFKARKTARDEKAGLVRNEYAPEVDAYLREKVDVLTDATDPERKAGRKPRSGLRDLGEHSPRLILENEGDGLKIKYGVRSVLSTVYTNLMGIRGSVYSTERFSKHTASGGKRHIHALGPATVSSRRTRPRRRGRSARSGTSPRPGGTPSCSSRTSSLPG